MGVKHQRPTITIIADASLNDQKKKAGFGGWIAPREHQPTTFSGPLAYSKHTSVLEIDALYQTMLRAVEAGLIDDQDRAIILQSDNLNAMSVIALGQNAWPAKAKHDYDTQVVRAKSIKPYISGVVVPLFALMARFDVVYVRHVKGHAQGTGRHTINHRCDRLARAAMTEQLNG